MDPVTVTVEGARKALGLGNTKIYELIGEGRLKTIKVGRRTLVKTTASAHSWIRLRDCPCSTAAAVSVTGKTRKGRDRHSPTLHEFAHQQRAWR